MNRFGYTKILSTFGLLCGTQLALAETVELNPEKDNTLYESAAGTQSNGAGDYLFVGNTLQTDNVNTRRALLRFNLTGEIPPGATINSAELVMNMSRSRGSTQTVSVHTVTADWGEGTSNANGQEGTGAPAETNDATWIHTFSDTETWTSAGGDFDAAALASQSVSGTGSYTFSSTELTSAVQDWLDNPADNFGVLLAGDESTDGTAQRFNSRENVATPPRLVIDFTAPGITVQLTPDRDNTLYETVNGDTSNGQGTDIYIGRNNSDSLRRAVLRFDTSSIPRGSLVTFAELEFDVTSEPATATDSTVTAHLLLQDWGESSSTGAGSGGPAQAGDATWLHTFFNTQFWNNPGGDFNNTPSSGAVLQPGETTLTLPSSTEAATDVTLWVGNPSTNFGWLIMGDETTTGNTRSFGSRESQTPPVLTVTYIPQEDLIFADGFDGS